MSVTDPRKLIPLLRDLEQHLARTVETYRATREAARSAWQCANEHSWRLKHVAQQLTELARQDSSLAQAVFTKVLPVTHRSADTRDAARLALAQAQRVALDCDGRLHRWTEEQAYALQQFKSAETELEFARQDVQSADARVRDADARLKKYQRAYDACIIKPVVYSQGHSNAPDCSCELSAVNIAKDDLNDCRKSLARALQRLKRAQLVFDAARQRLDRARNGFTLAAGAAQAAHAAVQRANESLAASERAVEIVHRAEQLAQQARLHIKKAEELSRVVRELADRMRTRIDEAQSFGYRIDEYLDHAVYLHLGAGREFRYMIEQLYSLNRTTSEALQFTGNIPT